MAWLISILPFAGIALVCLLMMRGMHGGRGGHLGHQIGRDTAREEPTAGPADTSASSVASRASRR